MNEFSPSELIYLYVDGEADAGQQSALFAALAHDNELQAEFNDALALRLSASTEVRKTVPAPALKSALFQKAGFSASAATGTAAPVVASAPALPVAAAATGWMAGAKGMMLPLLTAMSGLLMFATGAVLWYNSLDADAATSLAVRPDIPATNHPVQRPHNTEQLLASDGVSVPDESRAQMATASPQEPSPAGNSAAGTTANNRWNRRTQDGGIQESRNEGGQGIPHNSSGHAEASGQGNAFEQRSPVTRVLPLAPEQQSPDIAASAPAEIIGSMGDVRSMFPTNDVGSFSWGITARGIIGLRLFPWREMGTASDVLDNTVIGATWMISDEHSAGVEVGREVLPMFVLGSDGRLHETQSLMWGGVAYRYSPEVIQLSDGLRPYVSGFAGGSVSGPLLKSSVGLLWKPDTHIQFTLGAEGTFLMYRYQQQWYGTQKLGVSYGVTIAFP